MNRRDFLTAALSGAAFAALPFPHAQAAPAATLAVGTRSLDVNGRSATVYSLTGPDGRPGLSLDAGTDFDVDLRNRLDEPTMIHWHGLTPPWEQDGVPGAPSPLLPAGANRAYRFPVGDGGTHWMHAHTLQEQNLLAAPLVVRTAEDRAADEQEVVVLLHDFSFTPAAEILAGLRGAGTAGHRMAPMGQGAMPGHAMPMHGRMPMHGMGSAAAGSPMAMDLNDISYDAYLANDRTLADPAVVNVEKGGVIRLRIINGATATAFTIDLGGIDGDLIAVDGQPVEPLRAGRFPLTMGQRIDIRLSIPSTGGTFPILALREGAPERAGLILATRGSAISKFTVLGDVDGPVLGLDMETRLRARSPVAWKTPDRTAVVRLGGDMAGYSWGMAGLERLMVKQGQRVEIVLMNMSMMAHPIHLHGHRFQVVAVDGRRFAGAVRDTLLVPPMRSVTVAIDAVNPGRWAFHCHHLYHMASGMMAEFAYDGVA